MVRGWDEGPLLPSGTRLEIARQKRLGITAHVVRIDKASGAVEFRAKVEREGRVMCWCIHTHRTAPPAEECALRMARHQSANVDRLFS